MTKEEIYDAEVAPLMTQIIDICKAHGINLHATFDLVEEGNEGLRVTTNLPLTGHPVWLRLMRYLSSAGDNFDAFIMAAMKDAREYGHTSAALQILGVPVDQTQAR